MEASQVKIEVQSSEEFNETSKTQQGRRSETITAELIKTGGEILHELKTGRGIGLSQYIRSDRQLCNNYRDIVLPEKFYNIFAQSL